MSTERNRRAERAEAFQEGHTGPVRPGLLATNTGVRLACTMAAMIGLFGIFLCWAEKESRVIRRFAVQSAALAAAHAIIAAILLLTGLLLGGIPFFGMVIVLGCWLVYIAGLLLILYVRVRLMEHAWQGMRYELPLLENLVTKYY